MLKSVLLIPFIISLTTKILGQEAKIDPSYLQVSSIVIDGLKYTASYTDVYVLTVTDSNGKILFERKDSSYPDFAFEDFDMDGYKDLIISYNETQVPGIKDLLLYDKQKQTFVLVDDFTNYPEFVPIKGTKYYYSYHKSGCADMYWDSDLFFINNYKTIKAGNISGNGCDDDLSKKGIYVYKIRQDKKELLQYFPLDTLDNYSDYKWGFIDDFWNKNISKFE